MLIVLRGGFSYELVGEVGAVAGENGAAHTAKDAEGVAVTARKVGYGVGQWGWNRGFRGHGDLQNGVMKLGEVAIKISCSDN